MVVKRIVVGPMEANCYILSYTDSEAIIIDPGDDYERIKQCLERNNLGAKFIINTHGHIDHIGANHRFKLPILIHRDDAHYLTNSSKNLSSMFAYPYVSPKATRFLKDREKIELGDTHMEVIHTPGHTPGGICLKIDDLIFTGDTLFRGGIGRTDFPEASEELILKSIKERILVFDDNTLLYPGHGPSSTIGTERRKNPFICKSY